MGLSLLPLFENCASNACLVLILPLDFILFFRSLLSALHLTLNFCHLCLGIDCWRKKVEIILCLKWDLKPYNLNLPLDHGTDLMCIQASFSLMLKCNFTFYWHIDIILFYSQRLHQGLDRNKGFCQSVGANRQFTWAGRGICVDMIAFQFDGDACNFEMSIVLSSRSQEVRFSRGLCLEVSGSSHLCWGESSHCNFT